MESTVAPGTLAQVVLPILAEQSGRKLNEGFYAGICPERVMPGKLLYNIRHMSRVCGGSTPETARTMAGLYRHIVQGELDTTDIITAELVKTAENAYRDVQIAFANEVALICEAAGADVWRVRELVNKSPSRNMHLPGAGVGGHCIPKDPWLLAYGAQGKVDVRLIPSARAVNEGMPAHMLKLIEQILASAGKTLKESKIAILGYAYLENSDDTRHSPSQTLVDLLEERGVDYVVHDPYVPAFNQPLTEVVAGADVLVMMVAHQTYRKLPLGELVNILRTPLIVDGRHVLDRETAQKEGFSYVEVGVVR